jgi:SAM-dependent methyltransferase
VGQLLNLVTPLHESTKRDYLARMLDDKVTCMKRAREFEFDYWDGDRRYGYGGYRYIPGRWKPFAEALIARYGLHAGDRVLDMGCGKGYLLYEMQLLEPGLVLAGWDRSWHAYENRHPDYRGTFLHGTIQSMLPITVHSSYDLVISLGALHNLTISELGMALPHIERIARRGYLMVESYRDEQELFNLQCWCLTAETLMKPADWCWLYEHFGYTGDYEFIYFK